MLPLKLIRILWVRIRDEKGFTPELWTTVCLFALFSLGYAFKDFWEAYYPSWVGKAPRPDLAVKLRLLMALMGAMSAGMGKILRDLRDSHD